MSRASPLPVVYSNIKVIQCQAKSGANSFGDGSRGALHKGKVKTRPPEDGGRKRRAPVMNQTQSVRLPGPAYMRYSTCLVPTWTVSAFTRTYHAN
jgi:hypothetical protein